MDVIKMEPGSDPLGIQTSGIADIEEKKPLSEERNLLDLDVTKIKTECIDHGYDVKSEVTFEEIAVPIDFDIMKSEAEEEFCELDQVKEVKLEVTAEENEVLTESVAVTRSSGGAIICQNISQEENIHKDEKKYSCDVCGMCFPDFARLKNHGLVHIPHKRSGDFRKHSRIHTAEKPFSCDVCGKGFSRSGCLNNHLRVHTAVKPFSCEVCGKEFAVYCNLKTHLRTHIGEKPFSCEVCHKSFSAACLLKAHSRIHTGEKPFSCVVCGRRFMAKANLKWHSRLHNAEKPLNCQVCGMRFSYKGSLDYHVRDVCGKTNTESRNLKSHQRVFTDK